MSAYPPRYETLDSAAFARGTAWSAADAKAFEYARLRLRRKEQGLLTVAWPEEVVAYNRAFNTIGLSANGPWSVVVMPMQIPKARCVRLGYAVLTYMASRAVAFQVTSRAWRYRPLGAGTTGTGLGTGGSNPDVNDVTARITLPLLAGLEEEVAVFARGTTGLSTDLTILGLTLTGLRYGT